MFRDIRAFSNRLRRREWLALTTFPLIAGTFGPIASAFNICALVVPWRYQVSLTGELDRSKTRADPKWYCLLSTSHINYFYH